jgi:hypothetical protein
MSLILTPADSAPVGSSTRPRILPPVPWARTSVELTRQNQANSQRVARHNVNDRMETSRERVEVFQLENEQIADNTNLAIIA